MHSPVNNAVQIILKRFICNCGTKIKHGIIPSIPIAQRQEQADGGERRLSMGSMREIKILKSPAPSISPIP